MGVAVDNLKDYQKLVIELDEKVKNFDGELTTFYGRFKVLDSETDGGYSLKILNVNTTMVLHALLALLQSQSVRSTCDQLQLKEMKTCLLEIENLKQALSNLINSRAELYVLNKVDAQIDTGS